MIGQIENLADASAETFFNALNTVVVLEHDTELLFRCFGI